MWNLNIQGRKKFLYGKEEMVEGRLVKMSAIMAVRR